MRFFAWTPFGFRYFFPDYYDDIRYWSPAWLDNEHIVFVKAVSNWRMETPFLFFNGHRSLGAKGYLCLMKIDGTEKREIMEFPRPYEGKELKLITPEEKFQPTYITCSKNIIVLSGTTFIDRSSDGIATVGTDGTGFKVISRGKEAAISADSTKIVYADKGIWVMDIDGKNKVQLTDNSGDAHPLWSPDRSMIAFERNIEGKYIGNYILNTESKNLEKIWTHGFINWTQDIRYIWTAKGMIDFKGKLIKEYPEEKDGKVVPYGPLSPDNLKIISDFNDTELFVGDINGNMYYKLKAIQEIKYGIWNRKHNSNIWIKE